MARFVHVTLNVPLWLTKRLPVLPSPSHSCRARCSLLLSYSNTSALLTPLPGLLSYLNRCWANQAATGGPGALIGFALKHGSLNSASVLTAGCAFRGPGFLNLPWLKCINTHVHRFHTACKCVWSYVGLGVVQPGSQSARGRSKNRKESTTACPSPSVTPERLTSNFICPRPGRRDRKGWLRSEKRQMKPALQIGVAVPFVY